MGLAVLPARLKDELAKVKECFIAGKEDISDDEQIAKHADWYKEIRAKYTDIKAEEVEDMLKLEVGKIFMVVLLHAGVFKRNIQGQRPINIVILIGNYSSYDSRKARFGISDNQEYLR